MAANLSERAPRVPNSFSFGKMEISPNAFLSPMSGVTDYPFRRLISELASCRIGLFVSEFISVDGMTRLAPKVCRHLRFDPDQKPFMVQIFGSNPDSMERGAIMAEDFGADGIEINCGCPAPKIVRRSGGSGLLRNLDLYRTILQRVVKAVRIPVSVKVRIGFSSHEINVFETLKIAEEEGVDLFVVHGRTREQGYKGMADWDLIKRVKEKAGIPVIGNGDILKIEDVIAKLEQFGVDGVSIGRGAMHNPWIFNQVADVYEGKSPQEPSLQDQEQMFHRYAEFLTEEFQIPRIVLGRLKQICARMIKCLPNSARWRSMMLRSETSNEFFDHLHEFYQGFSLDTQRVLNKVKNLNGRESSRIEYGIEYKS